jgi:hypothetical protein
MYRRNTLHSSAILALLVVTGGARAAWAAPPVEELLARAEAARTAGRLADAASIYEQARAAAPIDVRPVRGACLVARERVAGGEKGVLTREPCLKASLLSGGDAEDFRNEVDAIINNAGVQPSMDDLALAALVIDSVTKKSPEKPWGYLARCDVARRLGSAEVLESCLRDLDRVAPGHPLDEQLLAFKNRHAPAWVWFGRSLLMLFFLGTLLHAARQKRSPRRAVAQVRGAVPPVVLGVVFVAVFLVGGQRAFALGANETIKKGDLSSFKIDDANPEASIPSLEQQNKKPLEFGYYLQDLLEHAEHAKKRGDHGAAARLYKAVTVAAPHAAVGPRLWCEQLRALGDPDAVLACRTALTRQGTIAADYANFVEAVLSSSHPLPAEEPKELANVISHFEKESSDQTIVATLRCKVAVRFQDTAALETCTQQLAKSAPNDPQTVSFQWALAMAKNDAGEARRLVDRAKGLGMAAPGLEKMEKATSELGRQRMGRLVLLGVALVLLAFAAASARRWRSGRRLASSAAP